MRLGLGTGSTAAHFVDLLGQKVAAGLKVVGVPTSERTRAQAESLNIPVSYTHLDVYKRQGTMLVHRHRLQLPR